MLTPLFLRNPADFAIIGLVDAVAALLRNYPLGVHLALERELPMLQARGLESEAADARDAAWTVCVLAGIPVAVLPVLVARVLLHSDPTFQLCLALGCLAALVYSLAGVYLSILKAERRFRTDAATQIAVAVAPLLSLPLALALLGVAGYFASSLFVAVVSLGLYLAVFEKRPRLRLPGRALASLLSVGFPIFVIGLLDSGYVTAARWRLLPAFGAVAFGLYFFGWKMSSYLVAFPQAVGRVYFPNFAAKLAGAPDERDLAADVVEPALFLGQVMALLAGGAALFLPDFVRVAYPSYAGSAEPMRIMLAAAWWSGAGVVPWKHLVAAKRWAPVVAGFSFAIAAIVFGIGLVPGELTVVKAAWVTGLSMALCNATFVVASLSSVSRTGRETAARLVAACAPFVGMAALVVLLGGVSVAGVPALALAALRAAAFALLWTPVLWLFWRRHAAFLHRPAEPADEGGPAESP
ncbi:MAG: oligosaccharide flippase family protein [Planctomycetia bacterium]|nr:oligosaccharide flippase family protein [Planctomycetia bacterium]